MIHRTSTVQVTHFQTLQPQPQPARLPTMSEDGSFYFQCWLLRLEHLLQCVLDPHKL